MDSIDNQENAQEDSAAAAIALSPAPIDLVQLKQAMLQRLHYLDANLKKTASRKSTLAPSDPDYLTPVQRNRLKEVAQNVEHEITQAVQNAQSIETLCSALRKTRDFVLALDKEDPTADPSESFLYIIFTETLEAGIASLDPASNKDEHTVITVDFEKRKILSGQTPATPRCAAAKALTAVLQSYHKAFNALGQEEAPQVPRDKPTEALFQRWHAAAMTARDSVGDWLRNNTRNPNKADPFSCDLAEAMQDTEERAAVFNYLEEETAHLLQHIARLRSRVDAPEILDNYIAERMLDSLCRDTDHVRAMLRQQLFDGFTKYAREEVDSGLPTTQVQAGEDAQLSPASSHITSTNLALTLVTQSFMNMKPIWPFAFPRLVDAQTEMLPDIAAQDLLIEVKQRIAQNKKTKGRKKKESTELQAYVGLSGQELDDTIIAELPEEVMAERSYRYLCEFVEHFVPTYRKEQGGIPVLALPVIERAFDMALKQFEDAHPALRVRALSQADAYKPLPAEHREEIASLTRGILENIPPEFKYYTVDTKDMIGAVKYLEQQRNRVPQRTI